MTREDALVALGWSLFVALWLALAVLVVLNFQGRYPFHTPAPSESCSVNQSTGDAVCDDE